jgi:hypothetical protein
MLTSIRLLTALLWLAAVAGAPSCRWHFVSEHVRLDIRESTVRVTGVYDFAATGSAGDLAIVYPFPADSTLGAPQILSIVSRGAGEQAHDVAWVLCDDGVHLVLDGRSRNATLEVKYAQSLSDRRAIYVLTTTREWGEPLRSAVLEVAWPDRMGVLRANWPLALASHKAGTALYRLEASPFMPDSDLLVTW